VVGVVVLVAGDKDTLCMAAESRSMVCQKNVPLPFTKSFFHEQIQRRKDFMELGIWLGFQAFYIRTFQT
jgi:hypothetical protein